MQRRGGASTITQQLARKLFLTDEVTLERKIKEWLLAIQIEKRYTKHEILTMYCNKMYWGHGVYGVEAASQLYFGKSVKDLTLDEAAIIAGLLQSNVRQSPYVNMKAALARRNYVLDRMAEQGFITAADAEAAKKRPIVTRGQPTQPPSIAPYFVETLRLHLEEHYGAKALYEGGLIVKTGIDPTLQRAANRALDDGLRQLDKLRGYRKPDAQRPRRKAHRSRPTAHPRWARDPVGGRYRAGDRHGRRRRRSFACASAAASGTIDANRLRVDAPKARTKPSSPGDLVEVRVGKIDAKRHLHGDLEQPPVLEGAVVAIDNHTGQMLAMVGGVELRAHASSTARLRRMRQVGSLFKPFVYTAAIDRGYTAPSIARRLPGQLRRRPGSAAVRAAELRPRISRADHAARGARRIAQRADDPADGRARRRARSSSTARMLGITTPLPEYLSVAIGSAEGTLLEMRRPTRRFRIRACA